jgi:SAM-dependent methyltransferase
MRLPQHEGMTKTSRASALDDRRHLDYVPAAGLDILLPGYDLFTRLWGMGRVYDALIAQAGLADAVDVLEIGCGTGTVTIRAKRLYPPAAVIGSDPDRRALARAARKARGLDGLAFEHGYAQNLPYPDARFDRVLSSMMFHHLELDVKSAAAAEAFRVLRPGGRLHLADIGGTEDGGGPVGRWIRRDSHVAGNLGDAIPRILRGAGFAVEEAGAIRHRVLGQLVFYRATRPA